MNDFSRGFGGLHLSHLHFVLLNLRMPSLHVHGPTVRHLSGSELRISNMASVQLHYNTCDGLRKLPLEKMIAPARNPELQARSPALRPDILSRNRVVCRAQGRAAPLGALERAISDASLFYGDAILTRSAEFEAYQQRVSTSHRAVDTWNNKDVAGEHALRVFSKRVERGLSLNLGYAKRSFHSSSRQRFRLMPPPMRHMSILLRKGPVGITPYKILPRALYPPSVRTYPNLVRQKIT